MPEYVPSAECVQIEESEHVQPVDCAQNRAGHPSHSAPKARYALAQVLHGATALSCLLTVMRVLPCLKARAFLFVHNCTADLLQHCEGHSIGTPGITCAMMFP